MGFDVKVFDCIVNDLLLIEGVEMLIWVLKWFGYCIVVISGGFLCVVDVLKWWFGIDYVFLNNFEIEGGKLIGCVVGFIVNV